jgi:vacuolar-type H+-ATPase subunit I/STV1
MNQGSAPAEQVGPMPAAQPVQRSAAPMPSASFGGGVMNDIRALNSSILLMTQKIKYVVRNEKILGRNLIVLNKKIKTLEEKQTMNSSAEQSGGASSEEVKVLQQKVALLEAQLEDLRSRSALKEEIKELKYVINSINPLEFTTLAQVRDLVDKRVDEKLKKQSP